MTRTPLFVETLIKTEEKYQRRPWNEWKKIQEKQKAREILNVLIGFYSGKERFTHYWPRPRAFLPGTEASDK